MALKLKTAPASEPFEVAELKQHLRLTDTSEDAVLATYIAAARILLEKQTNLAFVTQTYQLYLPAFARCVELPKPPLQQVVSVKYIDVAGAEQTVSDSVYEVDNVSRPGRLRLRAGQAWPTSAQQLNAVVIEYTAGFGNAATVPELLKHGMKMLIGDWYESRSNVITGTIVNELPFAVGAIVAQYRIHTFG